MGGGRGVSVCQCTLVATSEWRCMTGSLGRLCSSEEVWAWRGVRIRMIFKSAECPTINNAARVPLFTRSRILFFPRSIHSDSDRCILRKGPASSVSGQPAADPKQSQSSALSSWMFTFPSTRRRWLEGRWVSRNYADMARHVRTWGSPHPVPPLGGKPKVSVGELSHCGYGYLNGYCEDKGM